MMELLAKLKGGSLSETVVLSNGNLKIVRKLISRYRDREYGLVRWQSQIRKLSELNSHIPYSCPNVIRMGSSETHYFYDIPFYDDALNCVDALLNGVPPSLLAKKIIELILKLKSVEQGTCRGSLSVFIAEEMREPLLIARQALNCERLQLSSDESSYLNKKISEVLPTIDSYVDRYQNFEISESLTHGNLTLENLLWLQDSQKLIMIDPYAETYCNSYLGDISQVLQSCASGYEYISSLYESEEFELSEYPFNRLPNCFKVFKDIFTTNFPDNNIFSSEVLTLFKSAQFLRMFPFKMINNPRMGVGFMLHGIGILEETLC